MPGSSVSSRRVARLPRAVERVRPTAKERLGTRHRLAALLPALCGCGFAGCASTPGRDRPLDPVGAVAFCADGKTLAVSTLTAEVALFAVSPLTFRSLLTRDDEKTRPVAFSFRAPPIACSPSGALLVAAQPSGGIVGWSIASGEVAFLSHGAGGVTGLAFLPDGLSFVSAGPLARRWSAKDGAAVGDLELPKGTAATSVAVSPDGKLILLGLSSGEIGEIDATDGRILRVRKGHSAPVTAIAFSPDGASFASTAGHFDPLMWNRDEASAPPRRFPETGGMGSTLEKAAKAAQTAMFLAWFLGTVQGFRIVGAPTMGAPPHASPALEAAARAASPYCDPGVAYSPDGRLLAATAHVSSLSGEFHVMVADAARQEGRVISGICGRSVAVSREGRILATGGLGAPELWDAETGLRAGRAGANE